MHEVINLSHGAGGKVFEEFFKNELLPAFNNAFLKQGTDGAVLGEIKGSLVMSTDSHVVSPLFFEGGDIGKLAFCGTVNDLAMMGARPLYLTVGFIIEEGFLISELSKVVNSLASLSKKYSIPIVSGDTKVVERGKGDGLYITTAGLGVIENKNINLHPNKIKNGSSIIVSGSLGDHGMAIMSKREGISFESSIKSDCAPLHKQVLTLLEEFPEIQCLRDPTRGGLAAVLHELSNACHHSITIEESSIPVKQEVHAACELLGLDPLNIASEGRFVLFCPKSISSKVLATLKTLPECQDAAHIGVVHKSSPIMIKGKTSIGGQRIIPWPSGEQLPRIC